MWDQTNWDQVTDEVTRLQVRIAKATQAGRWNKVQALQRLLTRSHSGKLLAVKRVTENKGKRTAGVDGKIWSTPMSKLKARQSLTHMVRILPAPILFLLTQLLWPGPLRAVGRLEPCAVKVACTVLRGEHVGNGVL
jgi:hypothetical protein